MNASSTPGWFSSVLIFICVFSSVFISATPIPQTQSYGQVLNTLFPHYIVPIYEASPTFASPTRFTGDIQYRPGGGDEISVLVGFDVPYTPGAVNCKINFELPAKGSDPGGYPWTVTGTGNLEVYPLSTLIVTGQTSWNNRPARASNSPAFTIHEPLSGGLATITGSGIPCNFGQRMDFEIRASRSGASTFNWYELSHPKSGVTLDMY